MSLLDPNTWTSSIYRTTWTRSHGGDAPVVEPATGEQLGRIGIADAEDVAAAAEEAAAAQRNWAQLPFEERGAVLRRAAGLLELHAAEITDWLVREAGAARGMADFSVHLTTQMTYEASALPSHPLGQILPTQRPRLSLARRNPAGVVAVIAPFNAPTILSIRSIAPALALGNAVLLKPDPRTAVVGGALWARIFEEAGLLPGVLHVLPGGAETGEALITDPRVRVVSFTGSTAVGRRVGELASKHLKRCHLELGGNSAMIVLDDVDLDKAVSAGAWGSFLHQGQICMTTGRHLVHESIAAEYVERLASKADALPVGNPATDEVALGPIIDEKQRNKVHGLVTSSTAAGARLAAGGEYDGPFYRPTVLADVTPGIPAFDQEVFGPVAPVATFGNLDDAVGLASMTSYGLSLGILTADPMRGLALAERIPSGIVHINDQTVDDEQVVPFGGVGDSGNGSRFGGAAANIEAFTETQWVTMQGDIASYPI